MDSRPYTQPSTAYGVFFDCDFPLILDGMVGMESLPIVRRVNVPCVFEQISFYYIYFFHFTYYLSI